MRNHELKKRAILRCLLPSLVLHRCQDRQLCREFVDHRCVCVWRVNDDNIYHSGSDVTTAAHFMFTKLKMVRIKTLRFAI